MVSQTQLYENEEFVSELRESARLLVEKLQGDHYEEAAELIHAITQVRDKHIYQSVGHLTRGLHNAIVNFNVDGDLTGEPPKVESSEMQDASHRLNYVMELTQQAADKTMDKVDETAPIAMNLGTEAQAIREEWAKLKRRELSAGEFRELYERIDVFLEQMHTGSEEINQNLQSILLEQGFQDLTGQVLKRVISLITDVEQDLVSLVRIAGQVEEVTGIAVTGEEPSSKRARDNSKGEGPQMNAAERSDVVSGQDDVDDLLSSLGF